MKIPLKCQAWAEQMAQTSETKKVLLNILDDTYPPDPVETSFFDLLATFLHPESAKDAHGQAVNVVKSDREKFLCCGKEIPENIFQEVLRVQRPSSFSYFFPEGSLFLDSGGVDEKLLENKGELQDLIESLGYTGPFVLASDPNGVGVVWVTDNDVCNNAELDAFGLIDRLGLEHLTDEKFLLSLVIKRDEYDNSLHVPRCFDGIDFPPFKVQIDPDSDCGMTLPLSGLQEEGLPEAVHRFCQVERAEIKIED